MYLLLSMAVAGLIPGATQDDVVPAENQSGFVIESESDLDPFSSTRYTLPLERMLDRDAPRYAVEPGTDWDDDVIVYDGEVGNGQDMDMDEVTRHLYAICDTYHSSQDSILVFRSQNDGINWAPFCVTYSSTGTLDYPKIRLVRDSSGDTWVCMLYASDAGLTLRRIRTDGTGSTYELVAAGDVTYVDMDCSTGTGGYLYVTWVPAGTTDIWVARNHLDGAGWTRDYRVFSEAQVTPYPSIAAAPGGNAAVVFVDERLTPTPQIRISRSDNSGFTWTATTQLSSAGSSTIQHTDIDFTRGYTVTGWVVATFSLGGVVDCGFYYTTDLGASWTYGDTFPSSADVNERLGSVRAWKPGTFDQLALSYTVHPGDSVMYTFFTATSPDLFPEPVRVNDFNATQSWPSTIGWDSGGTAALLYTNWTTNYRLVYDAYSFTGIENNSGVQPLVVCNTPNPFSGYTVISFSLERDERISAAVHDLEGRLVRQLTSGETYSAGEHSITWNGRDHNGSPAPPGVYLCRVNSPGYLGGSRMILVR